MSGWRCCLVVGRRLSIDDCDLYYCLCAARAREVLTGNESTGFTGLTRWKGITDFPSKSIL
jgi:hypothetical protein